MSDSWLLGLRGVGIVLAILMGVLILIKTRQWKDPALNWLLFGLSVGPLIVLIWNFVYRAWLFRWLAPTDRITLPLLAGIQFRYIYDISNKAIGLACVLGVAIGICKLYKKAQQRPRLIGPEKAVTDDPRI